MARRLGTATAQGGERLRVSLTPSSERSMASPTLTPRRALLAGALAVLVAGPVAAGELPTSTFDLTGLDARGRAVAGTLALTPERDAFEVTLALTSSDGSPPASLSGRLTRLDEVGARGYVTRAARGIVGALGGEATSSAGIVRLQLDALARSLEAVWLGEHGTVVLAGQRRRVGLEGPAWTALGGREKQERLWREAAALPYRRLPALGSAGVGGSFGDTLRAFNKKLLDRTFASPEAGESRDVREPRTKIFHPFGAVAKVAFVPAAGHRYTGVLASGAPGIARLSLATDDATYIPGIGLKLLVDGGASLNVHAIPSFDGQNSRDFFERAPSTTIPPPSNVALKLFSRFARSIADPLSRSVAHLGARDAAGQAPLAPSAPQRLVFRPADVHLPSGSAADFRDQLAAVAPGSVIYRVFAEGPTQAPVHVGDVRTESPFVASSFGDRVLHFVHTR